ncbi:MAG TPA: CoA-acylating methylmalonate-semialdehyde dehydrogenase [Solirubrobacterales bacterium]|jgi:malonate-semialdehyde dehydrogenase (acetylating)/methylmalonate-semialdehyde dehydrogenase|nr:CoA-acylating methylmalonate-semialdehyde dehydrogenase [Solirubrobacterales bacterium]
MEPETLAPASGDERTATEPETLKNYIGGEWVESAATETIDDIDPATGRILARVPLSTTADVDAAARAARAAQADWAAVPVTKRARGVFALREALVSHRDELTRLVTEDMGKALDDARGEVGRGIESTEVACGVPTLMKGENLEGVATGVDVEMWRQPVGVVAAITPFNFPAMIPLWFLPYAIACGNTFILKPSERDPRTPQRIVELVAGIEEIPPGVVNIIHGAHDAVNGLLDHPEIDAISFVGQASTALHVMDRGTRSGKRVQALGGAKNSMVVMDDADLDQAVPAMMQSAFGNAGQRCLAGSVAVIVGDEERRREVRSALADAAANLPTGNGADEGVVCPPMVGADARDRLSAAADRAIGDGAEVVVDGRDRTNEAGALMGPTILTVADRESELAREELFGPLLGLLEVESLDEALEFVNASRYGNASVIFTSSGEAVRRYRNEVEAGMVGVNIGVPAPVAWFPFAGWKDSMVGDLHANGHDAIEFYTRKKVLTTRW